MWRDPLRRTAWAGPARGSLLSLCLGGAGEEEEAGRASAASLSGREAQVCSEAHGEHLEGGLWIARSWARVAESTPCSVGRPSLAGALKWWRT